ncbi:MAG: protein translocase subunit SecD [Gammaproteobacteria bacterium]|nr:protein translocase subunit SecD [Gammaproteobacteria bacterium]
MIFNRYPWWKNVLVVVIVFVAFLYAAPNLFGEDPSVQISGSSPTIPVDANTVNTVKQALQTAEIKYKTIQLDNHSLLLRFSSNDAQLSAKEKIQHELGDNYLVALNTTPATPAWLKSLGAMPMKLGLDLRGGVHLLLQVDVDSVLKQRIDGDARNISQVLRDNRIRYNGLTRDSANNIIINFRAQDALDEAMHLVSLRFNEFTWTKNTNDGNFILQGILDPAALQRAHQDTLDQAMNTLRNRVNELGVSEALVQQQGASRVAVDLPGIQNATEAKNILGKTATLEFHMVDTEHDVNNVVGGIAPPDTHLYNDHGRPVLLKNDIILRGSSIITATSGMGEDGRSSVDVRLGGGGEGLFTKTTSENIGKPMAVLYVEVKSEPKVDANGVSTIDYHTDRRIISVATIQSTLGNSFQITGLTSQDEARTLALLLRAGALPAPVTIIEEREVGPSLGKQNIHMGIMSVAVGFLLVVVFMAIYYSLFGIIADIALAMNLVLIVALLSILGATLTLPGIAAMVLTVGMAVDANVLIFERIREELRNGMGVQASIHAGYERAFATIVDANVTTLIVAIVLFSLGSGAVKGFAVTLTIGLITSMFTAITGTRAIVNLIYGGRPVKKVAIGM